MTTIMDRAAVQLGPGTIKEEHKLTGRGRIQPLVLDPDVRLTIPSSPVDFTTMSRDELDQLYFDLVDTMRYNRGIGLAAVQIGIPLRVFVMETGGEYPEALFNPRIVRSDDFTIMGEGCLSFPNTWVKVKRSARIRMRYQLIDGSTTTVELEGLSARVALHEFDHLEGLTMRDRAAKIHWERAQAKRKSYNRRSKRV